MKQYKINLTCGQTLKISKGTLYLTSVTNINGAEPIEIDVTEYNNHDYYFKFKQNNAFTQICGESYEIEN